MHQNVDILNIPTHAHKPAPKGNIMSNATGIYTCVQVHTTTHTQTHAYARDYTPSNLITNEDFTLELFTSMSTY